MIAKTLGESKGSADRIKVKDQQKGKIGLARQSDKVNVSIVQKLSKAGKFGSQKRALPTAMKPIFLENKNADGIVGRDFVASSLGIAGKEVTTAGKNPILAPCNFVDGRINVVGVGSHSRLSVCFK